ncbi:MAG: hypothetical protein CL844_06610 [Crocinitomicaceae bacterium]|nr:hypothetical protein [Crocinitomicaceae bacterium]
MIEIEDKVISTQIFEKNFVCDLSACKGQCCVSGDSGAPISVEEISILEDEIDEIKPFMRKRGIKIIENQGVFYVDQENEKVTSLIDEKECAFVSFNKEGIAQCSIEMAYKEGKTTLKKPISCHLFPIRVKKFKAFTALNYSKWDICEPACECGEKLKVPVFIFLKDALIRAFGRRFFSELLAVNKEITKKR